VCAGPLRAHRHDWVLRCASCGHLRSTLEPNILDPARKGRVNEAVRESGFENLRRGNFALLLDRLARVRPLAGARLLEVGCAHGWFLEAAACRGARPSGIEPDTEIGEAARARGLDVRSGLFPDALSDDARFDVLVFNDVFEHLPNAERAAEACRRALVPGGLLVLNIPLSTGVFYRTADLLDRIGLPGPFARMWQKGLASPHTGYFTQLQLRRLCERHGMTEVHRSTLPTLEPSGLWARLTCVREVPRAASAVIWGALMIGAPLLALTPADIGLQIFQAGAADSPSSFTQRGHWGERRPPAS
jgi:SAM-dependent methyltransferase